MIITSSNLHQISHDLRNYIAGISSLANIISENISDYQAKQKASGAKLDDKLTEALEFANMLTPHSKEALHYVDDILNSTQIETGKFTLGEITNCDVLLIINQLLILHQNLINEHKISIETNIENNLPTIKTDVGRLKQILINLVTNAIKYSHIGGRVKISAHSFKKNKTLGEKIFGLKTSEGNGISITIQDFGIGMSAEEIAMALNGDGKKIDKSALDKEVDSHGIGMTIVKDLVALLGGEMKIESVKGKGTKIGLLLCVGGLPLREPATKPCF